MAHLNLHRAGLSDLSPLACLIALIELDLQANQINDLKPLVGLTALTRLDIDLNPIRDLKPLAGLKALEYLPVTLTLDSALDFGPLLEMNSFERLVIVSHGDWVDVRLHFKTD